MGANYIMKLFAIASFFAVFVNVSASKNLRLAFKHGTVAQMMDLTPCSNSEGEAAVCNGKQNQDRIDPGHCCWREPVGRPRSAECGVVSITETYDRQTGHSESWHGKPRCRIPLGSKVTVI